MPCRGRDRPPLAAAHLASPPLPNHHRSGGVELLFGRVKAHDVELPAHVATLGALIAWMRDTMLTERAELFVAGDSVCVQPPPAGRRASSRRCRHHHQPATARTHHTAPRRRPGILVLVNDADWELEGTTTYRLRPGDVIAFISTLHGG